MKSRFISTHDAAIELLFTKPDGTPDLKRLHKFLYNHRLTIETKHRGSTVLIVRESLEAHLNRKQHAQQSGKRKALRLVTSRDQQKVSA
jgi:hypothetical protein